MMDNYSKQLILEHARFPQHYKKLKNARIFEGNAIGCSDNITIYINIHNGIINSSFVSKSCTLSKACASILMEEVNGKTFEEVKEFDEKWLSSLIGDKIFNSRIGCSSLALRIFQEALRQFKNEVE